MWNFLKNLFASKPKMIDNPIVNQPEKRPEPLFPLGARPNDPDVRDIPYVPKTVLTAMFDITHKPSEIATLIRAWQILGTCVAHTAEFHARAMGFLETGIQKFYSVRMFYVAVRRFLGYTELAGQGLPQREAAKVYATLGISKPSGQEDESLPHDRYVSEFQITNDMIAEANEARSGGFSFPDISVSTLQAAILDKKVIWLTVAIDWARFQYGTLRAPYHIDGYHEIALYGWENGKFICANWWPGYPDLYIPFDEMEQIVTDALVCTDIPNSILERAKAQQFIFLTTIKYGMISSTVYQLQKRLIEYGLANFTKADGVFGIKTWTAVTKYQKLKGLTADGIVGANTRKMLNGDVSTTMKKSRIDLWCEAITKMEGGKPERHNPGNLRYVGQKESKIVPRGNFCIFPDDATGYMVLRRMLVNACTGVSKVYKPGMTLYEFYQHYAPEDDGNDPKHYAEFVANYVGVTPDIIIKEMLP